MPARRFLALMGLSLALGCLFVGHGILLPALAAGRGAAGTLVDPNLARAISAPLAELASTLAAAGAVVVLALGPRAFNASPVSTLALAAVAACGLDRLVLLPRMHLALGRVDLVTSAPVSQMAKLEAWELGHQLCVATAFALLAAVAWIVAGRFASARATFAATQGSQAAAGEIESDSRLRTAA
jgi:hypothetical protein